MSLDAELFWDQTGWYNGFRELDAKLFVVQTTFSDRWRDAGFKSRGGLRISKQIEEISNLIIKIYTIGNKTANVQLCASWRRQAS
jgi:hypothetical protein